MVGFSGVVCQGTSARTAAVDKPETAMTKLPRLITRPMTTIGRSCFQKPALVTRRTSQGQPGVPTGLALETSRPHSRAAALSPWAVNGIVM